LHAEGSGSDEIRTALIGCGGRGTGAASNAMGIQKRVTRLVAMADVSEKRLKGSFEALSAKHPDRMSVSEDNKFIGFDAYKNAIDTLRKGDVAIFTTPVAFRWVHFKYAIEKGVNIFMEKPICTDGPTARRLLALNEEAKKKNLKVGVGLMCRHCRVRGELFDRIQNGEIGDLMLMRAYRMQAVIGSVFELFDDEVAQHRDKTGRESAPTFIAAIKELADGQAVLDVRQAEKQPDWTYNETDSGQWPADRLDDHRAHESLP
jgi:predicted dehydrogenase